MTDNASDAALAAAIAAIAADFDAAMPARVADLREVLARAAAGGADEVTSLVEDLHRLAGNAGTFGHAEVSARARDLEVRLADAAGDAGGRTLLAATLADVGRFLDDLTAAFPGPTGA